MDVKTLLNRCHHFKSFVYEEFTFRDECIHVEVRSRKGSKGTCSKCMHRGPTYDTARVPRSFQFVPLWGYMVFLWYFTRRIDCPGPGTGPGPGPGCAGCGAKPRLVAAVRPRRVSVVKSRV